MVEFHLCYNLMLTKIEDKQKLWTKQQLVLFSQLAVSVVPTDKWHILKRLRLQQQALTGGSNISFY